MLWIPPTHTQKSKMNILTLGKFLSEGKGGRLKLQKYARLVPQAFFDHSPHQ